MFRPRQIVLATLIIVPLLLYIVLGAYALWETGWLALIGWLLPLSWALTWVIAKLWPSSRSRRSAAPRPIEIPEYWTPRDAAALKIVREHQQRVGEVTVQNLTNPHYYLDAATVLATDLGRHYHPDQSEPLNGLTIPEVAAATRLAIDDMEEWLLETVPGNQIVTIGQWRLLAGAPRWINHARNAGWAASVLINPLNLVRYATSQLALTPITQELQGEMLATLFQRFLRQIGFYLIEMNSGRLRGGAAEYRRTFGNLVSLQSKLTAEGGGAEQLQVADITIALLGQVKAGKSSLVNALLTNQQAQTDVLPQTREVQRFQLSLPDVDQHLTLLDTPGYAEAGASRPQQQQIQLAVNAADLVLLVLAAHSPAREADRLLLKQLSDAQKSQPGLKPPKVIAVLTHIDLLSPQREWAPPYDWEHPQSPKEESIHGAIEYVQELFGDQLAAIVPVSMRPTDEQPYGITETLIPTLIDHVGSGQAAALVKAYYQRLGSDRIRKLLGQLSQSGTSLLTWWIEERLLPQLSGFVPPPKEPVDE